YATVHMRALHVDRSRRDVGRRDVDRVAARGGRSRTPGLSRASELQRAQVSAGERAGAELGSGRSRVAGAKAVGEGVERTLGIAARARMRRVAKRESRDPVGVVADDPQTRPIARGVGYVA